MPNVVTFQLNAKILLCVALGRFDMKQKKKSIIVKKRPLEAAVVVISSEGGDSLQLNTITIRRTKHKEIDIPEQTTLFFFN